MSVAGTNMAVVLCDKRRSMLDVSAVRESLTPAEMAVFKASIARPFDSYGAAEMVEEAKTVFDFVAKDVGYNKPDDVVWGQTVIRLVSILKTYYSAFTFDDVMKAFEMLAVGELDAYLPKDSNGNPDKKHYQQFNAEYLSKVLNAYRRERIRVIQKAQDAMPGKEQKATEREKQLYRDSFNRDFVYYFLRYKYTGRFGCGSSIGEMLSYEYVARIGYVDERDITLVEQAELVNSAIEKKQCNTFDSKMRRALLKKAFDEMIADEVQVMDYVKFN